MGQCSAQLVLFDGTILFCQLAPHQGQLHTFITDRVLSGQQDTTEAKEQIGWVNDAGHIVTPVGGEDVQRRALAKGWKPLYTEEPS